MFPTLSPPIWSLIELMMFEAVAMLLVMTAKMIIVAATALSFRFAMP
jgi:hypothetical protein